MRTGGGEEPRSRRPGARGKAFALQALLAALWVATWGVARIQEYAPHASLWFPPAGLTIAAFFVLGPRALPGIAAGTFLVTLRPWTLARAGFPLETGAHGPEDPCAREEPVHQHDHVVARAGLGHELADVSRDERYLAQQGEPLEPDELLQRDRESHLVRREKHDPCARAQLSA